MEGGQYCHQSSILGIRTMLIVLYMGVATHLSTSMPLNSPSTWVIVLIASALGSIAEVSSFKRTSMHALWKLISTILLSFIELCLIFG